MKNPHSTDGLAEELLRVIVQMGCSESHLKTLVEKASAELENGLVNVEDPEVVKNHLARIENFRKMMEEATELRRDAMRKLYSMGNGDNDYWCLLKHLGTGMFEAYETYMASDDDPELYHLWLDTNKLFIKAVTGFLGYEVTDCAACLHDMLKGE